LVIFQTTAYSGDVETETILAASPPVQAPDIVVGRFIPEPRQARILAEDWPDKLITSNNAGPVYCHLK
jgi:hypothetical protein